MGNHPPKRGVGLPLVAIVGRPNVGKSTLVNRILGRREVIVEESPGVTRDRKEVEAEWRGLAFTLADTGGWLAGGTSLDEKVSLQAERAIDESDVVVLVLDAVVGVTSEDARVAELLHRHDKPVLVVANKVDDRSREPLIWELVSLGLGDPWPVSALHGRGTGDLLDALVDILGSQGAGAGDPAAADGPDPASGAPEPSVDSGQDRPDGSATRHEVPSSPIDQSGDRLFSVAIVGRPNVGKSTLFNQLIGEDRAVVHDLPGTTRDAIDTILETEHGPLRFVDTAGMRRRSRVDAGTEYYSIVRALAAVDSADVALLVIDGQEGVTHQDQRLAERVDAAGCPVVVLLNKWETLDADARDRVTYEVGRRLHFIGDSPVLKISALTGKGVHKLVPALEASIEDYHKRVPTRRVNEVIRLAQSAQPAPHGARVLYATQGAVDPPTFTLFANKTIPQTYMRYLERKLREELDFGSTPLKLRVRRRSE